MTEHNPVLNDVQMLNLLHLQTIHAALARDRVSASYRFQLTQALAQRLERTTLDTFQQLLGQVGHMSLFVPRADLIELLDQPIALLPALAAAHAEARYRDRDLPDRRRST